MELSEFERAVLKTIAHFDVMDYPLTLLEIVRFSEIQINSGEVLEALNCESLNRLVANDQGLYYLIGREKIIKQRLRHYRLALLKLKKAEFFARIFSYFLWISAVAIYSSLSLKNSKLDGDIDLFFIAKAGRLWSARFFINSFLKIFNLRPADGEFRDRICASYLAAEYKLDLSSINYQSDYYCYYSVASFVFLSGNGSQKFFQANSWLMKELPNWSPVEYVKRYEPSRFSRKIQNVLESIFGVITEKKFTDYQLNILPQKYFEANDGKKVVLKKGIIKLHHNDKRERLNLLFETNYRRQLELCETK